MKVYINKTIVLQLTKTKQYRLDCWKN